MSRAESDAEIVPLKTRRTPPASEEPRRAPSRDPSTHPVLDPAPAFLRAAKQRSDAGTWAPEHEAYIRWLATPKPFRAEIRTKSDYARVAGVSRTTLYNWEALPGFIRSVEDLRSAWEPEMDRLCLEHVALNMQLPGREGVGDRELWAMVRGMIVEQAGHGVEKTDEKPLALMTLEELDAEAEAFIEETGLAEFVDAALARWGSNRSHSAD